MNTTGRGRWRRRRRAVAVGLTAAAIATAVRAEEAAPRGDRAALSAEAVEARVEGGFATMDLEAVQPSPIEPVPLRTSPVAGLPAFAPLGGDLGLGPVPAGRGAIDRLLAEAERLPAKGPTVPLPKRRPEPPAAQVASLGAAASTPVPEEFERPASSEEGGPRRDAAEAIAGEPKRIPKEALPYLSILRREAAANKVPLWLAIGVGWVESKYNPGLRGSHGVVGIMQVMPSTARYQGYRGPTEKLLEPETNIVWGMRELGWTWEKAKGDPCFAIAKYKGGIMTSRISAAAFDYCRKAKQVTGMP